MADIATPKTRLISIDILKALAVLLILNHRMCFSYAEYPMLATGGAWGCAIFFFISGYTMAPSSVTSFKSWMQKRLSRIIPSVLIIGFIGNFGIHQIFGSTFMWFVHCIIAYYIAFYFIRKYAMQHLHGILAFCCAAYAIYYICCGNSIENIYGYTATKYFLFFNFYLSGVAFRLKTHQTKLPVRLINAFLALPLLVGEMLLRHFLPDLHVPHYFRLISPLMIMAGIISLFSAVELLDGLGTASCFRRLFAPVFAAIGALSLESYIGLGAISPPLQLALAPYFPFNIPIVFVALLAFCYFLRVCTRTTLAIISGQEQDLTLRHILKPY